MCMKLFQNLKKLVSTNKFFWKNLRYKSNCRVKIKTFNILEKNFLCKV